MKENFRMLRKLWIERPMYVCGYFLNEVFTFLPQYVANVLFLRVVIANLSAGGDIKQLIFYLGILMVYLILSDLYISYFSQIAKPIAEEHYSTIFFDELQRAAENAELVCYDTPAFRDDFYYLEKNVLKIAGTVLGNFAKTAAGIFNLCLIFGTLRTIGMELLLFAAVSVGVTFLYNELAARVRYQIRLKTVPHERRRDYFVDLFFRRECIKERKTSQIDRILEENANVVSKDLCGVYREHGRKLAFYHFMKGFVPGNLILNFGMLAFLLYKMTVEKSINEADFVASFNGINLIVSMAMLLFGRCFAGFRDSQIDIRKFEKFISACHTSGERNTMRSRSEEFMQCRGTGGLRQSIELRNVSFTYPGADHPVLKDISMVLEPGRKIAIVGRNGSGKSTLTYLIMGLYEPQSGEILVGGIPKEQFTSFFQNEAPWPASLGENVAFDVEYEADKVRDALGKSGFPAEWREEPNRLVGREFDSEGLLLSGGEMQKLMLAHCFYNRKPYIVMDEPSSALDPSAEYEFNRQVGVLTGDSTVLYISHRLTTVKMADHIYVIDDGRVVQQGTHQALVREEGVYREMWEAQMKG